MNMTYRPSSPGLPFHSVNSIYFEVRKFLVLMKYSLPIFPLVSSDFGVILKKLLPDPMS